MAAWYQGTQESMSTILELELETIVSCQVGTRNHTWVLWKSNVCSQASEQALSLQPPHFSLVSFFLVNKSLLFTLVSTYKSPGQGLKVPVICDKMNLHVASDTRI